MKVLAINTNNNQSFTGVRKIVKCGPIDKIGDFLVRSAREVTTIDGIATTTKFFTPKGKFIGYHAVGNNGNVIGQRKFANGWEMQYWHDLSESGKKVLAVWITTSKATNKKPATYHTARLPYDTIDKNPRIYETKHGLLDLVKKCAKNEIGFIAMQPLCGGVLSNIPLALGYIHQYENVVPVWGARSAEELQQILYFDVGLVA